MLFQFVLVFFSDDLERYNQLQYTLVTDENVSLKDIEELLMQALVYRLIVFAYEVNIYNFKLNNKILYVNEIVFREIQ